MSATIQQFESVESKIEAAFWHWLNTHKISVQHLSTDPVPIYAYYSAMTSPLLLSVPSPAMHTGTSVQWNAQWISGQLINLNTLLDFKDPKIVSGVMSRHALMLLRHMQHFLQNLDTHVDDDDVLLLQLNQPLVVSYADLKKFHFHSYFALPALLFHQPAIAGNTGRDSEEHVMVSACRTLADTDQGGKLSQRLFEWYKSNSTPFSIYFHGSDDILSLSNGLRKLKSAKDERVLFVCLDLAHRSDQLSWTARNLLFLLAHGDFLPSRTIQLLAMRIGRLEDGGVGLLDSSRVFDLILPRPQFDLSKVDLIDDTIQLKTVGWEKPQGKLRPKFLNLSSQLDPTQLAQSAVNLNLSLIKWRLVPTLDLDRIQQQRVLILGAGTLGCYFVRCLIGWGIHRITLVDNAHVSYSNLTRQPCFEFEDVGKPKAECVAKNMKRVWPALDIQGIHMSIPMPGHVYTDDLEKGVGQLDDLYRNHDTVLIGMDSRESRWLPSVLARVHNKLIVNAALGFDTFVVMRHGMQAQVKPLGCYFCNDVVAPTDSLTRRTLDEQCTVTRPGIAPLCASTATELLINILSHPHGALAEADGSPSPNEPSEMPMGLVPHQVRGFLSHFHLMNVTAYQFEHCTACSVPIVEGYREKGWAFVKWVCERGGVLEEVSGLKAFLERDLHALDAFEQQVEEDDW